MSKCSCATLTRRSISAAAERLEDLFDTDDAATLRRLADIYFGHTPFTGYQRRAIAHATTQRHSIGDLLRIEYHVRRVRDTRHAWELRTHLCGVVGENIDVEARRKLKELLPPPVPQPMGVKHYRGKDGAPDTLIYRGPSLEVTRLRDYLDRPGAVDNIPTTGASIPRATDAIADDTAIFAVPGTGRADSAAQRYNLGDSRNRTPEAAPHIVLKLDDVVSLQHGEEDVLLTLTNGARVSGAEWAAMRLHEIGFVTLLHPVEGPVNLYRTSRFPNLKQRLMAAAESPLCSWPQCRQPASRSQIHHLAAWKYGGETNAANLTVLCGYHNGINNDDPLVGVRRQPGEQYKKSRGRMARQGGVVRWVPD